MTANDLFGTTAHVTWAQECARGCLIFAYGLLLVRVAGRRAFARWSALDIVVAIIVGSNLSRALTGNAPLFATIAATALLMLLHWAFAKASARFAAVSSVVEGPAKILGTGGSLNRRTLLAENVSAADLTEALRQKGVENPEQTRSIVLEPSGGISVLR